VLELDEPSVPADPLRWLGVRQQEEDSKMFRPRNLNAIHSKRVKVYVFDPRTNEGLGTIFCCRKGQ